MSEEFQVIQQQFWQSSVLVGSVELVQAETEFHSLNADVMITANRWPDLIFWLLMLLLFSF